MEDQKNKLHYAILSRSGVAVIKNLIEIEKTNPNELSNNDFKLGPNISCLILACNYSNIKVVKTLIKHGACVNLSNEFGETPLLHAVWNCKLDIVSELIGKNANVNEVDVYGRSPLYYACQKGCRNVVQKLLKNNAQINGTDNTGKTILSRAVCWGHYHIVKMLLKHNVKILNIDIEEGVEFQQARIVELLENERRRRGE